VLPLMFIFRLCLWFGYNYEVLDSDLLKVLTGR